MCRGLSGPQKRGSLNVSPIFDESRARGGAERSSLWLNFARKEIHILQPSHGDIQVSLIVDALLMISNDKYDRTRQGNLQGILKADLQYLCCRSDNATQGRGFTLQYRELTNGCGGSLQLDAHNDQQIIMSPNYPNSPPQVPSLPFSRCPLTLAFTCSTLSASGLSWLQQGSESTWTLTDWMSRAQGGLLHHNFFPASSLPS